MEPFTGDSVGWMFDFLQSKQNRTSPKFKIYKTALSTPQEEHERIRREVNEGKGGYI